MLVHRKNSFKKVYNKGERKGGILDIKAKNLTKDEATVSVMSLNRSSINKF